MPSTDLRLAELLSSLSLASDLGLGQPLGHGLRTCLLAVQLATEMGADPSVIRSVHHVALLRFLGCTTDASETARMAGGDDLAFNRTLGPTLHGGGLEAMRALVAAVGPGEGPVRRIRMLGAAMLDPGAVAESLAMHCEVAGMLARRLGLEESVVRSLEHAYERWDGKGLPDRMAGSDVPIEIRIAGVARDIDLATRAGVDVSALLTARRGKGYDPAVVDAALSLDPTGIDADLDAVLDAEPRPVTVVADLDEALTVLADFIDLKSHWTRGHSRRVAELAAKAGAEAGLAAADVTTLGRAALVHDVGRIGVESGVWDRPGPLAADDWEKVRLHTYLTQRILARCPQLASLEPLASSHHERLDGGGYHRNVSGAAIPPAGRILAAADVLAALMADRPHRPAMSLTEAIAVLASEVESGRLDRAAVSCVVAAAGGDTTPLKHALPAGLSEREVEVLKLIAGGRTNRQMADVLYISPKTVGRHVENIYAKIGVSTRAGATVFAMEHRLIG
ncbi:MAG TPA: HD domain-containing phosphohydrolase [Acidimicrobiia bacterium]|nr:HD domain-containing phosphohydrolase [Acidimicrobiia bacterium]